MGDDHDFEHSPLSGVVTRNGVTVEVEIYRIAGTQDPWQLEVVHISGGCTRCRASFLTEEDAYTAFMAMAHADGLATFTRDRPKPRH